MYTNASDRGDTWYLRAIASSTPLTKLEIDHLVKRLPHHDAQKQLIHAHLHEVVEMAQRYENHTLPLEDLIQEGNLCLVQVIHAYVPSPDGMPFDAYLTSKLQEAMEQARGAATEQECLPLLFLPEYGGQHERRRNTVSLGTTCTIRTPLDALLSQEASARLIQALAHMPVEQRLVLGHRCGIATPLPDAEIAEILGIDPALVQHHATAGIAHLQRLRDLIRCLLA
jgi:RNA polymerase sigma factor (sigma-70 family)